MKNSVNKHHIQDTFNRLINQARHDFCERLTYLYVGTTDEKIYTSPQAETLMNNDQQFADAIGKLAREMREEKQARGVADDVSINGLPREKSQRQKFNILMFCENFYSADNRTPAPNPFSHEADMVYVLNHELGHAIVPSGSSPISSDSHKAECAADAYAILRHIQLYGCQKSIFEYLAYTHACRIAYGDTDHYTAVVVHKIAQLSREIDISKLTPKETVVLANKIAREYYFSPPAKLWGIASALDPVNRYVKDRDVSASQMSPATHRTYYKLLARVMKTHRHDHDVWRACKLLLSPFSSYIRRAAKTDLFWKEFTSFIDVHEKEAGIILDLAQAMDTKTNRKASPVRQA